MKLGTQIYSAPKGKQKCVQIRYNPDERLTHALNFTGYAYIDHKYQLVKNILNMQTCIVTDNDIIACDDYISELNPNVTIVFVFKAGGPKRKHHVVSVVSNVAFKGCGASLNRLKAAQLKLKGLGIKTRLFMSEEKCLNYLNKKA